MPTDPPREGGGPNPPFGEDPFQRIINVHWGPGAPPVKPIAVLLLPPDVGDTPILMSVPVSNNVILGDAIIEFEQTNTETGVVLRKGFVLSGG